MEDSEGSEESKEGLGGGGGGAIGILRNGTEPSSGLPAGN